MKMRILTVFIILLIVFSGFTLFSGNYNLVFNSSFEDGEESLDGWHIFRDDAKSASFEWDKNTFHSGASSIKISASTFTKNASWTSDKSIPVIFAKSYTFSGWMKTSDVTGKAVLYVSWLGKKNEYKGGLYSKALILTNDWTEQKLTHIKVPEGAVAVILNCSLWESTGTVWFDDLEFYEEE